MAGISVGDAVLHLGADTSKLDKSLKGLGDRVGKLGKSMSLKLTAPLVAFAALSVKTAATFSKSMAKVRAVTGATDDEFQRLNDTAKELGRTTQFSASQVADAMAFMGMAGMTTDEIFASVEDTLLLAAAGALDMATAADIVTNIMAGFGMETKDLGNAVDVLTKAFTSSNVDLVMLGESMKYAAPVAKGFGMTFEETAAIMGIFGSNGIQASMAGTSLRAAIVQLDKKADEFGITMYDTNNKMLPMVDILKQLEDQGFTASEMMELFGLRAGPAMMALLSEGSEALKDYTTELENAGGTARRVKEVQMEGLHGILIEMKSAFEGLQIAIAEGLMPILKPLIEKLTEIFRAFADLSEGRRGMIIKTAIAIAAIGPALLILSQIIKAVTVIQWLWNAALAMNPIGLIIIAIIALGAAMAALGLLIHRHWDGIVSFFAGIGQRIKAIFMQIAESMYQPIRTAVDWIIAVINAMIRGFNSVFGWLGLRIGEIAWRMPGTLFGGGAAGDTYAGGVSAEQRREQASAARFSEEQRRKVALRGKLGAYQHGGPILGPTLLSSLRTGRPYAVAGEAGPESVVPGGRTINLYIEIDGQVFASAIGVPLVEEIRLKTGVRY